MSSRISLLGVKLCSPKGTDTRVFRVARMGIIGTMSESSPLSLAKDADPLRCPRGLLFESDDE